MGNKIKIASLFAGAGGLDLGFQQAGFEIQWANEFDKAIWATHELNFPLCKLEKKSIVEVNANDLPDDIDGFIGGPPCQSWSSAGAKRGIEDPRGQLFLDYIRLLKEKKPKFFLAENVAGILQARHREAFDNIIESFSEANYEVSYELLNAHDYGVPQDRKRVIIVGVHKSLNKKFSFPEKDISKPALKDAIFDLKDSVKPGLENNKRNPDVLIHNHEYMTGDFSSMFMSRNRVRSWDEPSFTIQAGGRHAPLHPSAPKMEKIGKDAFAFRKEAIQYYRRLSIRECARIQTFPDDFVFSYDSLADGYKMIGNAVPVELARRLASSIKNQIFNS